jgi:translation initiation factor 1 (eIF-1/SUI1)
MNFPFLVKRTVNNHLPVWREFKQNKTRVDTMIGKIKGNAATLKQDLRILTKARIGIEKDGKMRLQGDHFGIVKQYLQSIGLWMGFVFRLYIATRLLGIYTASVYITSVI